MTARCFDNLIRLALLGKIAPANMKAEGDIKLIRELLDFSHNKSDLLEYDDFISAAKMFRKSDSLFNALVGERILRRAPICENLAVTSSDRSVALLKIARCYEARFQILFGLDRRTEARDILQSLNSKSSRFIGKLIASSMAAVEWREMVKETTSESKSESTIE